MFTEGRLSRPSVTASLSSDQIVPLSGDFEKRARGTTVEKEVGGIGHGLPIFLIRPVVVGWKPSRVVVAKETARCLKRN
jgi:hypothetical protein